MDKTEARTTYALYWALHQVHKKAPTVWTVQECTRVLTAIMAAKSYSWRVIGITPSALHEFASAGFRSRSGQGITRAHLRPRIETVRTLMNPPEPLSQETFFDTWLANDATVLCAKGENRATIPKYIPIDNELGALFSGHRKLAGWHHRKAEQDFLRALHQDHTKSNQKRAEPERSSAKVIRKEIRIAHNKGKPNYLHSVEVDGVRYRSTWTAWLALEIGGSMPERKKISACEKFRGQLKRSKSGQLAYPDPTSGKIYTFRLIPFDRNI
jgi:hypothetical protein